VAGVLAKKNTERHRLGSSTRSLFYDKLPAVTPERKLTFQKKKNQKIIENEKIENSRASSALYKIKAADPKGTLEVIGNIRTREGA